MQIMPVISRFVACLQPMVILIILMSCIVFRSCINIIKYTYYIISITRNFNLHSIPKLSTVFSIRFLF